MKTDTAFLFLRTIRLSLTRYGHLALTLKLVERDLIYYVRASCGDCDFAFEDGSEMLSGLLASFGDAAYFHSEARGRKCRQK